MLPSEDFRTVLINRISWGAVFAGVAVAIVTQLLLNMLGLGIGVSTFDPVTGENPTVDAFSMAAAAWWVVSGLIAAVLGGYAAGRLSGRPKASTCAWHGLVAWAFTTLLVFSVLTTAVGAVVGGAFSAVGHTLQGAGQAVVGTAAPAMANTADPFSFIETRVREMSGGNDPAALRDAAVSAVRAAVTGDPATIEEARQRAAEALATAQSISVEEARNQVVAYEQEYRRTVDEAAQRATAAAEVAARNVSRGAIIGFVALLLGAIGAWFGGRAGAVDPTITSLGMVDERKI